LENKFGKSRLKFDINPDEAIAFGAAIAANVPEIPSKLPHEVRLGKSSGKSISRKNFKALKMSY